MSHKEKREEITERLTAMTRERDEWERRCKEDYKKFTEEIASLRAQLAAEKAHREAMALAGVREIPEAAALLARAEAAEAALAKLRDNEASAIVALTKASARADAAEDTAASAFDGMRVAKNRAEAAEARVRELEERLPRYIPVERLEAAEAALAKEREGAQNLIRRLTESEKCTDRALVAKYDLESQVAALTEKLEAAKRLTAPHLQEYVLRLEDENKSLTEKVSDLTVENSRQDEGIHHFEEQVRALTEKVAGLTAAITRINAITPNRETYEYVNRVLKETAPLLAVHDAAKQAELVEALRKWVAWMHPDTMQEGHSGWPMVNEARAILAKYPKEGN